MGRPVHAPPLRRLSTRRGDSDWRRPPDRL